MFFECQKTKQTFREQKQSLERFKEEHAFEDALTAILYEANLLQFENDELVYKKNHSTAQAWDKDFDNETFLKTKIQFQ